MTEPPHQLPAAAVAALVNGRKIEAIKIVRTEWNLGLKEAKDQVEAYARTQPGVFPESSGVSPAGRRAGVWLVLLILAAGLIYYLRSRQG